MAISPKWPFKISKIAKVSKFTKISNLRKIFPFFFVFWLQRSRKPTSLLSVRLKIYYFKFWNFRTSSIFSDFWPGGSLCIGQNEHDVPGGRQRVNFHIWNFEWRIRVDFEVRFSLSLNILWRQKSDSVYHILLN